MDVLTQCRNLFITIARLVDRANNPDRQTLNMIQEAAIEKAKQIHEFQKMQAEGANDNADQEYDGPPER